MDSVTSFVEQIRLNLTTLINTVSAFDEQAWIKIIIIYLLFLWCAIIIWVIRDVNTRGGGFLWQLFSVLLILFLTPILGLPLYLLIRPNVNPYSYEEDESYTPAWKYSEERSDITSNITCPACQSPVESDFLFCPYCQGTLKESCSECKKMIRTDWKICPYCGQRDTSKTQKKDAIHTPDAIGKK